MHISYRAQHLRQLSVQEREHAAQVEGKDKFRKLLTALPEISARTTWEEAWRVLEKHPEFTSDPAILALDNIQLLSAFEDHMHTLEDHLRAQLQGSRAETRRKGRLRREAFKVY